MPRYYFHLTDGKQVLNNHKGIDLSGNATARADAATFARDLKHGAVMPGSNNRLPRPTPVSKTPRQALASFGLSIASRVRCFAI